MATPLVGDTAEPEEESTANQEDESDNSTLDVESADSSDDYMYEVWEQASDIITDEKPARGVFDALNTYCLGRRLDINEVAKCIQYCNARCQEESNECKTCNSRAKDVLVFIHIYCSNERIRPDVAAELLRLLSKE